jgi:ribonuclease BN (tRNA processing enzyme)
VRDAARVHLRHHTVRDVDQQGEMSYARRTINGYTTRSIVVGGVTLGDTGRGGTQFNYGAIELGHLHGNHFADLPFTRKLRDELIAAGRAEVHPPLPTSGWVRRALRTGADVEDVIALFRLNYERARAHHERKLSMKAHGD